jgi:hypothetical protein
MGVRRKQATLQVGQQFKVGLPTEDQLLVDFLELDKLTTGLSSKEPKCAHLIVPCWVAIFTSIPIVCTPFRHSHYMRDVINSTQMRREQKLPT